MEILRSLALAAIMGAALVGCRKELPITIDPRDHIINNWSDAFEAYWDGINYNYVFWDVDTTDWDKVYSDYKPKFANLQLDEYEDDSTAVMLIEEMSKTLIDHHMVVEINTRSVSYAFSPGFNEVYGRSYFHFQYDKRLLYAAAELNETANRITNKKFGTQLISGHGDEPDEELELLTYLIDGDVAYMTLNSFALTDALYAQPKGEIQVALDNFINIINNTPELKGVIVDVRQNGGGNTEDIKIVMGSLISTDLFYSYSHSKNGLGRLDYSPWTPCIVSPNQNLKHPLTIPIVALIDISSASMSEATAQAIQSLPNGHVIGERSHGAMGPIRTPFKYSYAGPYDTEIMSVFTSSHSSTNSDGKCLEGIGITPDIEVLLDMEAMNNKMDNQLERAIDYIHTGK